MTTDDAPQFERITFVKPAYDCVEVQPCVHGSPRCGLEPGDNHGRHNAELHMTLRGADAELILVVNTGWYLAATPLNVRTLASTLVTAASLAYVETHWAVPTTDVHPGVGSTVPRACPRWDACQHTVDYDVAELAANLVARGSAFVWSELEAHYAATFPTLV